MGSNGFLWLAGLILCIVTADTRSDTWGRGTATTPASSPAAAFCHLGRVSLRSAQAPQSRRQAVCRIPLVMSDPPATRSEETLEADFAHIPTRESSVERIPKGLKNRYFALRHGQSEANVENIISSLPARGTTIHGLTQLGREQARDSAPDLLNAVGTHGLESVLFCSSNFTRARQTAEEAAAALMKLVESTQGAEAASKIDTSVEIVEDLRERWFGELDNTIITNYNMVWPADMKDAACTQYDVESVDECCKRLKGVILDLEARYQDRTVVLTSHADTLQILQSYIAGADPRKFSQYRFKNGEVRALKQDPSSMPEPVPLTYA